MNLNLKEFNINKPIFRNVNFRDLIIFLVPLMLFILYLYVYNPGILTYDSYTQLHQIATGHFTNWHPFFYTFIEMICLKIYATPATVGVLQILVFSVMWTIICKYHRDDGNESSNQFALQFALTLIICLIPINAVYSISLWKDVLFCYSLMFLCFLIKVMIDRNGQIDYRIAILMALMMACIAELRVNGIYIVIVTLIVLAFYLFRKNRSQKMHIILPALTIVFILLIASLNMVYDVQDHQRDAVLAKTSHMLADYDLNLELDDSDRDKIHKIMDENKIKDSYTPYYSDPIYWITNKEAFNADRGSYITMAIKYSLLNPLHFAKYMLKSSAIVWDITRDEAWEGEPYYIYEDGAHIENARDQYYQSTNETPVGGFDSATAVNLGSTKYNLINSFVNAARENGILNSLFNSPALYMYLAIILLVLIHFITKSKSLYLIYLPVALNIIVIFLSLPIQETRFLYSNLLVCYLIGIIFINVWLNHDARPQFDALANDYRSRKVKFIENHYDTSGIDYSKLDKRQPPKENYYDVVEEDTGIYDELEAELDKLTQDDINEMLGESAEPLQQDEIILQEESAPQEEGQSDLIDEILKEIEAEKEDR